MSKALESVWESLESFRESLGNFWEPSGNPLGAGSLWEASGSIWTAFGSLCEASECLWEASGTRCGALFVTLQTSAGQQELFCESFFPVERVEPELFLYILSLFWLLQLVQTLFCEPSTSETAGKSKFGGLNLGEPQKRPLVRIWRWALSNKHFLVLKSAPFRSLEILDFQYEKDLQFWPSMPFFGRSFCESLGSFWESLGSFWKL